jgi:hypothetical protein
MAYWISLSIQSFTTLWFLLSLKEGFCPLTPQKALHIVYFVNIDTI